MLLGFAANPNVPVMKFKISDDRRVVILKPDRSLHYPGIEKVRNLLSKKALKHRDAMIVVDCVNLIDIDFTGAKGLGSVADALRSRNQTIIFVNVSDKINHALKGFTQGGVQTYETAQDWIDTLVNVNDRMIVERSMSNLDDVFNNLKHQTSSPSPGLNGITEDEDPKLSFKVSATSNQQQPFKRREDSCTSCMDANVNTITYSIRM
jgi:anti-anti-sigma regulatory factor